ncbi:hypothetical protein LUZ60_013399 [Juncus effusus]|nr:hypothetical protein LUZ60_013399 [Juncus effusus]
MKGLKILFSSVFHPIPLSPELRNLNNKSRVIPLLFLQIIASSSPTKSLPPITLPPQSAQHQSPFQKLPLCLSAMEGDANDGDPRKRKVNQSPNSNPDPRFVKKYSRKGRRDINPVLIGGLTNPNTNLKTKTEFDTPQSESSRAWTRKLSRIFVSTSEDDSPNHETQTESSEEIVFKGTRTRTNKMRIFVSSSEEESPSKLDERSPQDQGDYKPSPNPEEEEEEEEEGDFILQSTTGSRDMVYKVWSFAYEKLYTHQKEGIEWFWVNHCEGRGTILADDMGLGKTKLVCTFLSGLFRSGLIGRVLVVVTTGLVSNWEKELSCEEYELRGKITAFEGHNVRKRIIYEHSKGTLKVGIKILTYHQMRKNAEILNNGPEWDYVIADEAHSLKNSKSQQAQRMFEIESGYKILITGTPLENNLIELWTLCNICSPGLLGDEKEFKKNFERVIRMGNDKNATLTKKHQGTKAGELLRKEIKNIFLRRLKSVLKYKLPNKTELIVWLKLSNPQKELYENFLKSIGSFANMEEGSQLAAIHILRDICNHPSLLKKRAVGGEKLSSKMAAKVVQNDSMEACKIAFILPLVKAEIADGKFFLIFSQSVQMLDIIAEKLRSDETKFYRLDGSTEARQRAKLIEDFQNDANDEVNVFLLTTRAGGAGITLTGASRVLIVDPAWNPSIDNQSVDRAYRIGQQKNVIVYRLMTCGTIEEKICKLQNMKSRLFRTVTEEKSFIRYFSEKETHDIFRLPDNTEFNISKTHLEFQEIHAELIKRDIDLQILGRQLIDQGAIGVDDYNLLFSKHGTEQIVPSGRLRVQSSSHSGDKSIMTPNDPYWKNRPKIA